MNENRTVFLNHISFRVSFCKGFIIFLFLQTSHWKRENRTLFHWSQVQGDPVALQVPQAVDQQEGAMLANWHHKRPLQQGMVPAALPLWWASTFSRQAEQTASSTLVWLPLFQPLRPNTGLRSQLVGRLQWRVLTQLWGWNLMADRKSSRTGLINMTAEEKVGSRPSTDMMKSPLTDGERCQSHQTEGNMGETGKENLTETGGIGVKLAVETGAPPTLAVEVTEIGLVSGLLPPETLVGAAVGKMVPNWPHLLLVLSFQILSLLSSLEAIVVHWRTSRSLRWSGPTKIKYPPTYQSFNCHCLQSHKSKSHSLSFLLLHSQAFCLFLGLAFNFC